MESQIPGSIPRIFPFVRHGDNVVIDHVKPFAVPDALAAVRAHRVDAVFLEPFVGIEKEVLLAPEHPGQGLAHDIGRVIAELAGISAR